MPAQVRANGLIIFIPKYGIEGTVHLNPKDREGPSEAPRSNGAASEAAGSFLLDEEKQTVASPDGSLAYTVFDKVRYMCGFVCHVECAGGACVQG